MIFCLDTHKLDILQSFKKCYIVIYTKETECLWTFGFFWFIE